MMRPRTVQAWLPSALCPVFYPEAPRIVRGPGFHVAATRGAVPTSIWPRWDPAVGAATASTRQPPGLDQEAE